MSLMIDPKPTTVPTASPIPLPVDEKPPTDGVDGPELVCQVCGVELTYGGRGPKPRYCSDHKKTAKVSSPRSTQKSSAQNQALASQATELVIALTDVLAVTAMLIQFPQTEHEITEAQDPLREKVYASLLANPRRARSIINLLGGATDMTLLIALSGFSVRVGSAAVAEFREKKAARKSQETDL